MKKKKKHQGKTAHETGVSGLLCTESFASRGGGNSVRRILKTAGVKLDSSAAICVQVVRKVKKRKAARRKGWDICFGGCPLTGKEGSQALEEKKGTVTFNREEVGTPYPVIGCLRPLNRSDI